MPRFILSVDGGGIRGIIPALVLAEIEARIKKPLAQVMDLITGTSTGGLIAAGLAAKPNYSANELVLIYEKHGAEIFQATFWDKALSWVWGVKYSHKNLEKLLDMYFKESSIRDASTNLLLPTYDIKNNEPFFLQSWRPDRSHIKVKDALRAATAAPTYFIPKHLIVNEKERVLVDAGVFANNPSVCAFAAATKLFPNEEFIFLSLGTGITKQSINFPEAKRFGKVEWISPLLHLMLDSGLGVINYQMTRIIRDNNYMRIQVELTKALRSIDTTTSKNIRNLQLEASKAISQNSEQIDRFCKLIT